MRPPDELNEHASALAREIAELADKRSAAMARGAGRVLGADAAVAVTGVGGPDPQHGQAAGTVCFAATYQDTTTTLTRHFDGEPEQVLDQTVVHALRMLRDLLA